MDEYKKAAIQHVLICMWDMGANSDEIAKEKKLLENDDHFLAGWCEATNFDPQPSFYDEDFYEDYYEGCETFLQMG